MYCSEVRRWNDCDVIGQLKLVALTDVWDFESSTSVAASLWGRVALFWRGQHWTRAVSITIWTVYTHRQTGHNLDNLLVALQQ